MTSYRLLVRQEVLHQLTALRLAAKTQPGGLRDREFRTLELGLRAIANGQEEHFAGKRLGFRTHDLSDCAEIKLSAIPESRGDHDLGPSHRLIYREFQAEDGGPPYRQVLAFEPRKDDRPFEVTANRLGRERGVRLHSMQPVTYTAPPAPLRFALTPDIRTALAAAGDVASARGAVTRPQPSGPPMTGRHRGDPPERSR